MNRGARGGRTCRGPDAREPSGDVCRASSLLAQALLDDASLGEHYGRIVRLFEAEIVAGMSETRFILTDGDVRSWLNRVRSA